MLHRWLSCLVHVINARHRELSSMYYIGLPTRQTPVTAIDARWRQTAYARSCCIQPVTIGLTIVHAGTTKRIRIRIRILQTKFEFQKNSEFNIPSQFAAWNFCFLEHSLPGTFTSRSELAGKLSLAGTSIPCFSLRLICDVCFDCTPSFVIYCTHIMLAMLVCLNKYRSNTINSDTWQ